MNLLFNLAAKFGLPSWLAALVAYLIMVTLAFGAVWAIYDSGKRYERADWVNKQNIELVQRQQKILELTTANRLLERKAVTDYLALKQDFERKLNDEKTHTNAVIADVRNGVKRLRINTKAVPACNGGVSLPTTVRRESAGETRTELSESAAEFLIRFASDADQAVINGNEVKDFYMQCRSHVDALRAQSLNQAPSNLTTTLKLDSKPKENQ